MRYSFFIPPVALALCLVVSVLCAFISCLLPYRRIIKSMSPIKSKDKGEYDVEGIGLSDISEKEED